jgi:hypothetical protein
MKRKLRESILDRFKWSRKQNPFLQIGRKCEKKKKKKKNCNFFILGVKFSYFVMVFCLIAEKMYRSPGKKFFIFYIFWIM